MRVSNDIDKIYLSVCRDLLHAPKVMNTRELTNVKIQLKDINNNVVGVRDISLSYLFGELLWYFNGMNDVEFISKFSRMWERLTDDGETCNSAYGYLMKYKYGFDQIDKVITLLKIDPDSRRAVINLNVPNENMITTKDEPCTVALQFLIRKGRLHCTTFMRSNDIWFGFPYDVAFFTELQKYVADELRLEYGTYTHFVTSVHLYDKDYETVKKIVEHPVSKKIKINHRELHKDKEFLAGLIRHSRNPKEDVVELFKRHGIYEEV